MASIKVQPNVEVLSWAINRSKVDLRSKFKQLDRWLKGEAQPTLSQLEELAKATSVPFGYFFLTQLPEEHLPIPHFRTLTQQPKETPSPEMLDTIYIMRQRQEWMRDYLLEQGHEPLPFVRSISMRDDPCTIAQRIREQLGIDSQWAATHQTWINALQALREKTEDVGILVVTNSIVGNNPYRKLDVDEFRGFVLVDEFAPLVFINGADGKAAQMFTLAHELAHIWLGTSAAFDLRNLLPAADEIEQACNRIAAEFLVPEEDLRRFWNESIYQREGFQPFARQFKVSEIVVARRALDLNLISREVFFAFYKEYQSRERSTIGGKGGGNFYSMQTLRLGRLFAWTVVSAVREGRLLYRDAYRLTGLYGKTFEQFAEHLTGGRV
ncbi:MAG: HigA protein (antitoxin to HigB) [Anaerolineae bacterium]|nr:MAG: HigA protein (antitoxin to HigB) [Anaerolineae bacterium]